jgi:flagellar biosynthesis/type III secretory pathway chaperone
MSEWQPVLAQCLEQTLAGLKCMKRALEQEESALRLRDAAALDKSTRDKEILAGGLNTLAQKLEALLRAQGAPPGLKGVARLLAQLPETEPASAVLRKGWREIVGLMNACRKLNEINGAYIGLLRQHTQRSLDILHERSSQDMTYGPDGLGRRAKASRKLVSV